MLLGLVLLLMGLCKLVLPVLGAAGAGTGAGCWLLACHPLHLVLGCETKTRAGSGTTKV